VIIKNISRERPVLIAGPTASGKSALAMELAARDGRVIVNADALQVYDMWRVLTARPSMADEAALPHALFGHIGRDAPYSTGHWLREAAALLDRPLVIVGGTGLNFAALLQGLANVPAIGPQWRAITQDRLAREGLAALARELDAPTRAKIDVQNPARVARAWAVLQATGRGLAAWQAETPPPLLARAQCEALVLSLDVATLDARIARRFGAMLDSGALDEVRAALPYLPEDGRQSPPPLPGPAL
jgi:tRNA dimethylallyltransferase